MRHLERFISNKDSDALRESRNVVADWLRQLKEPYATIEIDADSPFLQYLMHKELRLQFPDIWTYPGKRKVKTSTVSGQIILQIISLKLIFCR